MLKQATWWIAAGLLAGAAVVPPALSAPEGLPLTVPFSPAAWLPDGGDARWLRPEPGELETNGFYLRAPKPGQAHAAWLAAAHRLRAFDRTAPPPTTVRVAFGGVRAWTRVQPEVGRLLHLQPGEALVVRLEARWLSGNPEICFALDYLDPQTFAQKGWSGVLTTARLPQDGEWHPLEVALTLPPDNPRIGGWANLIVGQDATRDATPGQWEMRGATLHLAGSPGRRQALRVLQAAADRAAHGLDRSIYDRPDLAWGARNFACYFLFLYDTAIYDRQARRYRVEAFLDEMEREFGGVDSVVLWQAYPRIGVDQRNQFDFYRDLPGGLAGLKEVTARFHRRGVRVFIDYNPWDTGTRREEVTDAEALGRLVRAIGADGIFLDTMVAAPDALRPTVDRYRRGVLFEPEGSPEIAQISACSASWAQWLPTYPEPGVLRLKWLEPRHMQHQIRRWDRSHAEEIVQAFFNGSGMLIWENVFGTHNPWNVEDRATWRQAVPILRAFWRELASEAWEPFLPTLSEGVFASRWIGRHATLYLLVNQTGKPITTPILQLPALARSRKSPERVFDLWRGVEIPAPPDGLLSMPLEQLGAVAVVHDAAGLRQVQPLLNRRPLPPPSQARMLARPHDPRPVPRTPPADPDNPPPGMVLVPRATIRLRLSHERRECGCYPDPGTPAARQDEFTFGAAWNSELTHDYLATVGPFLIDECLVTNGEYEAFLKATGYRPAERRNFLKHWPGGRCPAALRDHPVVYVDLEDAQAYARWAGKRLPTEAEWQLAGQGTDGRPWPWGTEPDPARANGQGKGTTPVRAFPAGRSPYGCYDMAGNVWQWTESERDDGHTRYAILRGGSYFSAEGSVWYVRGGAQPLTRHAKFLLLYPGLDRCATIGFRCVKDVSGQEDATDDRTYD